MEKNEKEKIFTATNSQTDAVIDIMLKDSTETTGIAFTKQAKEKSTEEASKLDKSEILTGKESVKATFPTRLGQEMGVMELNDSSLVAAIKPMYADSIQSQKADEGFFPGLSGSVTWFVLLQAAIIFMLLMSIKRRQLKRLLNRMTRQGRKTT
jgi:hypothetical protein